MRIIFLEPSQQAVGLSLTEADYQQFKQLVDRGFNTWDTAPDWIKKLHEVMNSELPPALTATEHHAVR